MSKMKKILAMILTLAMVMGMTLTAFADTKNTATITVNYANDATLSYVQVIEPDVQSATGWQFTSDAIAEDYTSVLVPDFPDEQKQQKQQKAIAMLIKYAYAENKEDLPTGTPAIITGAPAATATQINQALDNVINGVTFTAMSNPQTVESAGVYAIKATETNYTYKPMAAYVGFGAPTVDGKAYEYPSLVDAEVSAKKIPTTVTKADDDADNAVAIGQPVTYTITTPFPYFNQNDTDKTFLISDTISGASYTGLTGEGQTATVVIGSTNVTEKVEFVENQDGTCFKVDLSAYIDNKNTYANQTVTVTYQAVVEETKVINTASSHIAGVAYDSEPIRLYTGKITLTKVDAADSNVKLEGAGFEVKSGNKVLTFAQKDTTKAVYTYDPDGDITEVFTDENGEVVVEGLDIGIYTFKEKTAPTGYSVNENPLNIELDITDEGEAKDGIAVKIYEDADQMADTKLTALPSTGGIGTTIFTIVGCLIMVAAAGMFFVIRRRENC